MNKCVVAGLMGLAVGMYIGYSQEEGIEDLCRESRRKKKKVMKKMHKTYDHLCDCMGLG